MSKVSIISEDGSAKVLTRFQAFTKYYIIALVSLALAVTSVFYGMRLKVENDTLEVKLETSKQELILQKEKIDALTTQLTELEKIVTTLKQEVKDVSNKIK